MDATHVNGNTHNMHSNNPLSEKGESRTRERVLAARRALTKQKAALVAVVSAVLLVGGAYAAKVYLDKK